MYSHQASEGVLFQFSFSNFTIFALNILYVIVFIQFLLIRDPAFLYYKYYIACNLVYLHGAMFFGEHNLSLLKHFIIIPEVVGCSLILNYYFYTVFAIWFLDLKKSDGYVYNLFLKCSYYFLILFLLRVCISFIRNSDLFNVGVIVIIFACIPVSIYCIWIAFRRLHGPLPRIFFSGTLFYLYFSILGFLFSSGIVNNPFDGPIMKNWIFYTEVGILIEAIFFYSGLTYKMRLIQNEHLKIQKELLIKEVDELKLRNALIEQKNQISQDLHDDLGSNLTAMAIQSSFIKNKVNRSHPELSTIVDKIQNDISESQDLISDTIWSLRPQNSSLSKIIEKLNKYATDCFELKKITWTLAVDPCLITKETNIKYNRDVYLICKEVIHNVLKHASATRVCASIRQINDRVIITITDDGKGFDTNGETEGNGLTNIKNRVKTKDIFLSIESKLGQGTKVEIVV